MALPSARPWQDALPDRPPRDAALDSLAAAPAALSSLYLPPRSPSLQLLMDLLPVESQQAVRDAAMELCLVAPSPMRTPAPTFDAESVVMHASPSSVASVAAEAFVVCSSSTPTPVQVQPDAFADLELYLPSPDLIALDSLLDSLPCAIFDCVVLPFLTAADLARMSALGKTYKLACKRRLPIIGYGGAETIAPECITQFPGGLLHLLEFWGRPLRVACGVMHGAMLFNKQIWIWGALAARVQYAWPHCSAPHDIVCGYFTTYVRTVDGTVYALDSLRSLRLVARNVLRLAAGDGFAVMYTKAGRLLVDGVLTGVDMIRIGDGQSVLPLTELSPGERILELAAGARHILVLTSRQRVLSMGDSTFNQLGREGTNALFAPMVFGAGWGAPQAVAAGERHSMVLFRDGRVRVCGTSSCGELGLDNFSDAPTLSTVLALPGPAVGIAAGHRHSLVNVAGNSVYAFGMNTHMQLGVQSAFWASTLPRPATRPFGVFPRDMAAGSTVSVFCDASGSMYAVGSAAMCAGADDQGQGVFALAPM